MNNIRDKKYYIELLEKHQIYHNDLPVEYQEDNEVIVAERIGGGRILLSAGFDIITQVYFVSERLSLSNISGDKEIYRDINKTFEGFDEYFDYLGGNIYDNACYYQCDFSGTKKKINRKVLLERQSLINYTISDHDYKHLSVDIAAKKSVQSNLKEDVKVWINKFVACDTVDKLEKVIDDYEKSFLYKEERMELDFFFWQYVFYDLNNSDRLKVLMSYRWKKHGYYFGNPYKGLFLLFDPTIINNLYYCEIKEPVSDKTDRMYKKRFDNLVEFFLSGEKPYVSFRYPSSFPFRNQGFFSDVIECRLFSPKSQSSKTHDGFIILYRFFESLDDLIAFHDNEHQDMSSAEREKYDVRLNNLCEEVKKRDVSDYKEAELTHIVKKYYINGRFCVEQIWKDPDGNTVLSHSEQFRYFFDFIAYLSNDLSGADLLLCEGLSNLRDVSALNFRGAMINSNICDSLGINYEKKDITFNNIESFEITKKNEEQAELIFQDISGLSTLAGNTDGRMINYITDIHLLHQIMNYKPKSSNDVRYVIRSIVDTIINESQNNLVLIGGDLSSDFVIFDEFISYLNRRCNSLKDKMVFILGNHELWPFPGNSLNKIVDRYRSFPITLVHNEIIYKTHGVFEYLKEDEIINLSCNEIQDRLRCATIIILGGIGFCGCETICNANMGLYRDVINRDEEIKQSERFLRLYNKVLQALPNRKVIVLTHMPMESWNDNVSFNPNYIYVSGHTHGNYFRNDNEAHIYADNQVGYSHKPHLKWFSFEYCYDYFDTYNDGIYEITADEYYSFYRGRNISLTFNRKDGSIIMLKKYGYYCFLYKKANDRLFILYGGVIKGLANSDVNYYFDKMDYLIDKINAPFRKYEKLQKSISKEIQLIGGKGTVHGCIVDVDYFNHIYVNPSDLSLTPYAALKINKKFVYPSIESLLENNCPQMYKKYLTINSDENITENLLSMSKNQKDRRGIVYDADTRIYCASRGMNKLQRLNSNILTFWVDIEDGEIVAKEKNIATNEQ